MWIPKAELEEVLGKEQVDKLLQECGGERVYIAQRTREDSALVQRIGLEVVEKLSKIYGGTMIELPSPVARRVTAKRQILELLRDGGMSHREIAFMLQVSIRYVEMVKQAWVAGELDNY